MEICDLMNINELSEKFYQVKYYIHCWETQRNSTTSYVFSKQLKSEYTTNKLTELSKLVDF